jgi:hypothetical protein
MLLRRAVLLLVSVATACATTSNRRIPDSWLRVPQAPAIRSVTLDSDGKAHPTSLPAVPAPGPITVRDNRLFHGGKALTEAFPAIDSFDYSPGRREVAFSARRESGFDIGLVADDGSVVNWVPGDPADEIGVQWAPRGNKISFIVRARGGDIVRTVHVPTAMQLAVPFPLATIHALAWDPQAERYAVVYSTPVESDQVEIASYDGTKRSRAVEPAAKLDFAVEPLAPDAMLLRPRDVAYEERLPVVIWQADDFGWSDARAELLRTARVACVVTRRAPDPALWRAVGEVAWIDPARVWMVVPAVPAFHPEQAVVIAGDATVAPGFLRENRGTVTVAPAVVQSVAAGLIPDLLKRTPPTNGSSR